MDFLNIVVPVAAAVVAAISLATGKTLNPLRGFNPFIISRAEHPSLYWLGVGALVLTAGVWGWAAIAGGL